MLRAFWLLGASVGVLFLSAQVSAQADDDPLAELAALGDAMAEEGPEGGGSIRAKRDVDPAIAKRKGDKRNVEGKVQEIVSGKFPFVAVKIKVSRPAKEGDGSKFKKNELLVVVPKLKLEGKRVAMDDGDTRLNAGAFYLQSGDRVLVRVGAKKGQVWEAEYIERK